MRITKLRNCLPVLAFLVLSFSPAYSQTMVVEKTIRKPSCYGDSDGEAYLQIYNVQDTISITWQHNGSVNDTVTGLSAGYYSFTVVDSAFPGQPWHDSVEIINPPPLNATSKATSPSCSGSSDGSIDLTAVGGIPPYTYSWSTGAVTEDVNGLAEGSYSVTITDANGCVFTKNATIAPQMPLDASLATTSPTCLGNSDGSIDMTVAGGTPPYTYSWSNGAVIQDLTGISAGIYTVTITDANGCTLSKQGEVAPRNPLIVNAQITPPSCFQAGNAALDINAAGGTAPYSFAWSDGTTTQDRTGLSPGSYQVTVTDVRGCTATRTFTIPETLPLVVNFSKTLPSCYGTDDGRLEATVSGGTAPYTMSWEDGTTGPVISTIPPGGYTFTVTDANACSITQETVLPEQDSLSIVIDKRDITCPAARDGQISATVTGGTPPFRYQWSYSGPPEIQAPVLSSVAELFSLPQGAYNLAVTDHNGCSRSDSVQLAIQDACLKFANLYFADDPRNNQLLINGADAYDFSVHVYGISAGIGNFMYEAAPYSNADPLVFEHEGTYKIVVEGPEALMESEIREKIIVK